MQKSSSNFLRLAGTLVLLIALGATLALAQTSNGTIAGVVTDPTGAVITNATVTAKSAATGDTRTATTNSVGAFRFESVMPGAYDVTVSAPNFTGKNIQNLQVVASTVTSQTIVLAVGGSKETVNVEATGEILQTENGEISKTMTTVEISKLPISSLNPYSLATLLPGVVTGGIVNSFTNGTSFAVNGTRPRANNFLIEGQDNNDAGIHGQGLQPINTEAVKEVSIMTNAYAPEFGAGGGSVSNVIYKSGSNKFHGSVWELFASSALNANDHYNNYREIEKPKDHENTYGFAIGGPVLKNKVFFFASQQWDKYRTSSNGSTLTVPTAAGVATLLSLPSNARITNLLTAIGSLRGQTSKKLLQLGNGRPAVEVGQTERTGVPASYESPELDLKGDYLINSNNTLNLRYIKSYFSTPYDLGNWGSQYPGFDTLQHGPSHNAGFTFTHIFSPSVVNETRVSYGRIGFTFDFRPETFANPLAMGPTWSGFGISAYGNGNIGAPQGRFHNTYQYQDGLTWMKGTHTFKFGFDINDTRVRDEVPYNWGGNIAYASSTGFTSLANYIDDFGGNNAQVTKTFGSPIVHASVASQSFYFQDTWKMRPNFTVSYGVRYELPGTPGNSMAYPAMNEANPNDPAYPAVYKEKRDTNNFGPRVSFAYSPRWGERFFGQNKTVIRAGFGVFYDGIFTNILDNTQAASPNSVGATTTSIVNSANPRGTANWSQKLATLSPKVSLTAQQTTMADNLHAPKTLQWNFNVQRDLGAGFTLQAGYIGTRGIHLFSQRYLNPLTPAGTRVYSNRGPILARDNSGDSVYHALETEITRRFSKGMTFHASYTYSHNIDDVSEIFTTGNYSSYPLVQGFASKRIDRADSAMDRRQRLALSYTYDIPKFKATGFAKALSYALGDWSISGTTAFQAGAPANVEIGYDENSDGISNDRPTLGNPSAPMATYGWVYGKQQCEGTAWWNTSLDCQPVAANAVHWVVPDTGNIGSYGRNAFLTHGRQDWTFALARAIKLHSEQHQLTFRMEMFNPFNHANTGVPDVTLSGIPYVAPGSAAQTVSFMNYAMTQSGNRSIRLRLGYQF